jgi:hypothetical protein
MDFPGTEHSSPWWKAADCLSKHTVPYSMYCCITMYCRFPTYLPAYVPNYCVAVVISRVYIRQNLLRFPYIVDVSALWYRISLTSRDHHWRPTLASVSNCLRMRLLRFTYKALNKPSTIPKHLCRYHSDIVYHPSIHPSSRLSIYQSIYRHTWELRSSGLLHFEYR